MGKWSIDTIKASFPGGSVVKNPPASAGDVGLLPGLGRPPGEGNGNPLQYSCLEKSMDRGTWWATACGVTKSWTRRNVHTHTQSIEMFYSSEVLAGKT